MAGEIRNKLLAMMQPGGYQGSAGYQFARDQGEQALNRKAAAGGIRGTPNALAALIKYGTGVAAQDYGNEFDRLTRAYGVEDQGAVARERNANDLTLGTQANTNTATRNANDFTLGTGRLGLDTTIAGNNRDLGFGRLGLDASTAAGNLAETTRAHDLDYSLGSTTAANNYDLGRRTNDTNAQRNWFDYDLGGRAADTAGYNARTQRGAAQSQDWYQRDQRRAYWNPRVVTPGGY